MSQKWPNLWRRWRAVARLVFGCPEEGVGIELKDRLSRGKRKIGAASGHGPTLRLCSSKGESQMAAQARPRVHPKFGDSETNAPRHSTNNSNARCEDVMRKMGNSPICLNAPF